MKIRLIFSLIVGIAIMALAPITLAGGHGGASGAAGFGVSGHAGGGGFHGGGGVSSGGHIAVGVGTRGGGVGFGGMPVPGRVPNFEGTGPRFSSFGHPSHAESRADNSSASRPVVARQPD